MMQVINTINTYSHDPILLLPMIVSLENCTKNMANIFSNNSPALVIRVKERTDSGHTTNM